MAYQEYNVNGADREDIVVERMDPASGGSEGSL